MYRVLNGGVLLKTLVDRGELDGAHRGRLGGWFFTGPADLGFPFQDVEVATELGPAPAWLVPAASPSSRWGWPAS